MPLIPPRLVSNRAFRESFAETLQLAGGVVSAMVSSLRDRKSVEPQDITELAIDGKGAEEARLRDAMAMLVLLGSEAALLSVPENEGLAELAAFAAELRVGAEFSAKAPEFAPLFRYDSVFAQHAITVAAFGEGPTYSSSSFEPTLRIFEARGKFLAVRGIQATVQFFDSDGDVREFSFGMTEAEAKVVAERLGEGMEKLRRVNPSSLELFPPIGED